MQEVRRKIYVVQFKPSCMSHPVSPEMTSLLLNGGGLVTGETLFYCDQLQTISTHLWPQLRRFDFWPLGMWSRKNAYKLRNRQASLSLAEFIKQVLVQMVRLGHDVGKQLKGKKTVSSLGELGGSLDVLFGNIKKILFSFYNSKRHKGDFLKTVLVWNFPSRDGRI